MKLTRFNQGQIGLVVDDRIIDVTALLGVDVNEWPQVGMNRVIARFDNHRAALESAQSLPGVPLSSVKLLTPVPGASKVIAYPINYHDHAAEMDRTVKANQLGFFLKPPSSLCGAGEPIVLPAIEGRRIDHECELGIIIGKGGRDIPRERWQEHVFGYSCLMDIVVRGKEERVARKAYDTFCPVGPWIITADELGDPTQLQGRLWVNDELRQDANTRDLIVDIPGMIELASHIMMLEPGDIIAAGTPAGVGPIRPGDKVRIEFERVGSMTMDVVQGTGGKASIFAQA
ncbi:MAG: FAA hydrolase family protein [Betaproteobacteria bacterium]|nr:FAA hydrolase family protein [Betaproteobacteria bacterium]NDD13551.1 FAA hydrolase family protein [Betaproteobacteria bacterium]